VPLLLSDLLRASLCAQPAKFASEVLPRYFKHRNFSSFVRQLNLYNFKKTGVDPTCREFRHPLFVQGRVEWLPQIKRKSRKKAKTAASTDGGDDEDEDDMEDETGEAFGQRVNPMSAAPPSYVGEVTQPLSSVPLWPLIKPASGGRVPVSAPNVPPPPIKQAPVILSPALGPHDFSPLGVVAGAVPTSAGLPMDIQGSSLALSEDIHRLAGGIDSLRGSRREADAVLQELVSLKRRQGILEQNVLRLSESNAKLEAEASTAQMLRSELVNSRQRLSVLKTALHKLYVLVYHMYQAFKASHGQLTVEQRDKLAAIEDIARDMGGDGVTPLGLDAASARTQVYELLSPAVPAGSPMAEQEEDPPTSGVSSFAKDGALPFQQARTHWRFLMSGTAGPAAGPSESAVLQDLDAGRRHKRAREDVTQPPPPEAEERVAMSVRAESLPPMIKGRSASGESDIGSPLPDRPQRPPLPLQQTRQSSSITDELGQMAADLHDDQQVLLATLATAQDRLRDAGSLLALPVTSPPPPQMMRRGRSNTTAASASRAKRPKLSSNPGREESEYDFNFEEMDALSSPSMVSLGELDDDPPGMMD
jgi:hypothetical protein